jgi:hypothetical protein
MSYFFVVSGLPASGKSMLGRGVASQLGLPLLDKDEILEALFDTLGTGEAEWQTKLSRSADQVLQRLAMRSNGAVMVSWWKHPQFESTSGTSTSWLHDLPGQLVELHCNCSPRVALDRFFARGRHEGHLDGSKSRCAEEAKFRRWAENGPLGVGRLVVIDTERPADLLGVLRTVGASV